MPGDVKKYKVYVKDPKTGNVKKVNFGDKKRRPAVRDEHGRLMIDPERAHDHEYISGAISAIDDTFYGGCWISVLLRPWYFNGTVKGKAKTFPKRLCCGFTGVKFVKDDKPFGNGRIDDSDAWGEAGGGDDGMGGFMDRNRLGDNPGNIEGDRGAARCGSHRLPHNARDIHPYRDRARPAAVGEGEVMPRSDRRTRRIDATIERQQRHSGREVRPRGDREQGLGVASDFAHEQVDVGRGHAGAPCAQSVLIGAGWLLSKTPMARPPVNHAKLSRLVRCGFSSGCEAD
jgi:hypothetical protein